MPKKYLLDTNIFIDNPASFYDFRQNGDNVIVVPLSVLRELDRLKKEHKTARDAIKMLEDEQGNYKITSHELKDSIEDDIIIHSAKKEKAILITRDRVMRIKARQAGVEVQDYNGVKVQELPATFSSCLCQFGRNSEQEIIYKGSPMTYPKHLVPSLTLTEEQQCVMHALNDPTVPLVAISGIAGTGKTLLSILYALRAVVIEKKYQRILITRSPEPFVKDIGLLPGDVEEKMSPWLYGLIDNYNYILEKDNKLSNMKVDNFYDLFEIRALAHIRGSSLDDTVIIVDEVQNLHPKEMSTIVSRTGKNSKMILLGDTKQVDSPYLTREFNGLSHTISKMYGHELFSYINLTKSMRSAIAEAAAELL